MKLLKIEDLHIVFTMRKKKIYALQGISFDLNTSETLGIVGESGSGKSVCMQSIVKLLPSPPAQYVKGKIVFDGVDLFKKNQKELIAFRGKKIGFIFQDPMTSLNPTMKIGKQILEVTDSKEQVYKLLDLVGITNKRFNSYPHELSGGEKQRIMIAIALASSPKILVADEPTTALDITVQSQIIDLLKDLQKKINMSIIFISHDIKVVASIAKRILVMYSGEKIEEGLVEDIINKPKHPYTKLLLKSIPSISKRSKRLVDIKGSPPSLFQKNKGCCFVDRCPFKMEICYNKKPKFKVFKNKQKAACFLYKDKS